MCADEIHSPSIVSPPPTNHLFNLAVHISLLLMIQFLPPRDSEIAVPPFHLYPLPPFSDVYHSPFIQFPVLINTPVRLLIPAPATKTPMSKRKAVEYEGQIEYDRYCLQERGWENLHDVNVEMITPGTDIITTGRLGHAVVSYHSEMCQDPNNPFGTSGLLHLNEDSSWSCDELVSSPSFFHCLDPFWLISCLRHHPCFF